MSEDSLERQAVLLYNNYTSNHPTIHCNRFPSWSELTEAEKQNWYKKIEDKKDC